MFKTQRYKENAENRADALEFLGEIEDECVAVAFFDPQYRGVLDKLQYGNEGERQKERAKLPQMTEEYIISSIRQIDRVLKSSGYLFLWVDKFHLCEGIKGWLTDTALQQVDLIAWDKGKIGMGYRTRRKSEYLIVLQKQPVKAKSTWTIHNIPDVWQEKVEKVHPHSKPIDLQAQLIAATSKQGDIILDPASGGYSVFKACQKLKNRIFIGCDILQQERG